MAPDLVYKLSRSSADPRPSPSPSRASVRRSSGEYCPGGCSDVAQMRVRVWVRVRMSAGVTGRAALVLVHIVVFGVVRLEDRGVLSRPDPSCYPTLSIFLPLLGLVPRARCAAKRNSIPISSPRAFFSTNQSAAVVVEAIAKLGPGEPRWVYDAHTGCRMYNLEVTEFIFHFLFSRIRRQEERTFASDIVRLEDPICKNHAVASCPYPVLRTHPPFPHMYLVPRTLMESLGHLSRAEHDERLLLLMLSALCP